MRVLCCLIALTCRIGSLRAVSQNGVGRESLKTRRAVVKQPVNTPIYTRRKATAGLALAAAWTTAPAWAAEEEPGRSSALVWRPTDVRSGEQCGLRVRRVFPGPFVNYLSRFLLVYDKGSRALWRSKAELIPLGWDTQRVKRKRTEQFAEFMASVEAGLCDYAEKSCDVLGEVSETPQLGVRQLLSLLRSRYGELPDASRQLALTFALLDAEFQPTEAIVSLSAKAQNASVVSIKVLDGGLFRGTPEAAVVASAARLTAVPALEGKKVPARLSAPVLVSRGAIVSISVTERGCGYTSAPHVTISPPTAALSKQAKARAVIDDKGRISRFEVLEPGSGYGEEPVSIEIEAAADSSQCGEFAQASPVFEYEVGTVAVLNSKQNFGYTSAQPLNVHEQDWQLDVVRQPRFEVVFEASQSSMIIPPRVGARDSASETLTTLLRQRVPVWDGKRHKFPSPTFFPQTKDSAVVAIRRDRELTSGQLARLALAGAVATAATRGFLNPLEVQKTRKQAGSEYDGETDSWLGVDASAAAGAALGMTSFGVYELLRRNIPKLAIAYTGDSSFATAYELQISLLASVLSVLVAASSVAPLEAAKVRLMLPDSPNKNLPSTLKQIAATSENGYFALWDGFVPLLARELPFTCAKLLVYSSATSALFAALPAARERPEASFAIACASGALAGAVGALLSTPADAIVTELATGKHGKDFNSALTAVLKLDGSRNFVSALPRLFAGARERMILFAVIIAVQLLLFDWCRSLLQVSPEDLSLSLDVFADRLSFYEYQLD